MKVSDFPELAFFKGHTLIHTDGTTLLGADDKAGVAEIMTAAEYAPGATPRCPTERSASASPPTRRSAGARIFFDVAGFRRRFRLHGRRRAWRVSWNTRTSTPRAPRSRSSGLQRPSGSAPRTKMINAIDGGRANCKRLLPAAERPRYTEGYEGFYHLTSA